MKTQMTSFDVAAVVHELHQAIEKARIENIYQIGMKQLLLRLHKPNTPTMQLLIEVGKRLHLTNYSLQRPSKPPVFCMALRKHLDSGVIGAIRQYEFERIITFTISTRQDVMQLVVELFGEGNAILTNSQGSILAAMAYKKMRDRNILRNEIFRHAPSSGRNPLTLTRRQLDELTNLGSLETVRALTRLLSIGGPYAEEILLRASVDKNTPCKNLTQQQLDAIFSALQTILSVLRGGKLEPAIVIDTEGNWVDVTPISLEKHKGLEIRAYASFNQALDEYFAQESRDGRISEVQEEYGKELAKQQRMLQEQQKASDEAKKAVSDNKRDADAIYSHLNELQLLQQQILDLKQEGRSWEEIISRLKKEKQLNITPAIYFDSFDQKNLILNVSIDGTVFPVQLKRSIQANAADYYERMKKAERKREGSEKALQETQTRLQELKERWSKKIEETQIEQPVRQKEKPWYEKFRWFVTSDGFLVVGGRDATTNEILIKKHVEPHDIVFHADIVGAPFAVVKTEGKPPTEQAIEEAAKFAASYSRGWREMLSALDVYWVRPEQISKTGQSGQYLEKGAFMIKGGRNYVKKAALRIAIGLQKTGREFRVIGGPVEAVRKHTNVFVEIVPGDEPSAKLAKRLRYLLSRKVTQQDGEVVKAQIEEIQRFIPLGKGAVASGTSIDSIE